MPGDAALRRVKWVDRKTASHKFSDKRYDARGAWAADLYDAGQFGAYSWRRAREHGGETAHEDGIKRVEELNSSFATLVKDIVGQVRQ